MANDYYPDFYRRKRQRDHVFVVLRNVFLFVLVCALGATLAYLLWRGLIAPRSKEPGATPQMADERQNMETQQKLQEARPNVNSGTVAEATAEGQRVDLTALPYSPSFPLIQIGIGEGSPAAADAQLPGTDTAVTPGAEGAGDQAAATQTPVENEAITPDGAAEGTQPVADSEAAQQAAKAEEQKAAAAKAEAKKAEDKKAEAKKAEQARLDKKKADNAKKAEQAKKEEQKEKVTPPAKSGGYTYRVYAGTKQSREAAEKLKSEVAASGVSATIVQNGSDYLLLVGTLDDFDGAMALKDKLVSSGFGGAFTTRKSK